MKTKLYTEGLDFVIVLGLFAVLAAQPAGAMRAEGEKPSITPQADRTGKFDGPAELPRVFVESALTQTPAPGKVVSVKSGEDFQAALDNAACGDVLELEAGSSFTGHFRLPRKNCDDAHWIIVRSSEFARGLPAEGSRITPCYAGVSSLPGRPDFHCASTKNLMAKVISAGHGGVGPILFSAGANHYRFIGIEITREPSPASVTALAMPDGQVPADHIIFDRVWMHGTAQDETRRGVFLSGTTYMAVVDSFFSDFHCTAREGDCTDSQTISGASGDLPMGPYKIVNNFLEAAGENILFGGTRATSTPADIEIRHNFLFKPRIWMRGEPGFVGGPKGNPFIVKNLFELKNARRVLFEGNILENSWGGFSQTGFAMLLTPRNQYNSGLAGGVCPTCSVTDVTIRDCWIAHVGSGMEIADVPNPDGSTSAGGERYSLHDVVFDDIDGKKYDGFGAFLVMISNRPTLKDVAIRHVTALSPRVFMNLGVKQGHIQNFVFTSNLIGANRKEITPTDGKADNCVSRPDIVGPAAIFKDCFDSIVFSGNAIVGGFGSWPPGNFSPKDDEAAGVAKGGAGLDAFRLCHAKSAGCKGPSKYADAGTDHKDVGADIDRVKAATQGVRE